MQSTIISLVSESR